MKPKSLDDLFADFESELLAEFARIDPAKETARVAKIAAKSKAEFERGVANGWHDNDGNPIDSDSDDDDDDDDDKTESDSDDDKTLD